VVAAGTRLIEAQPRKRKRKMQTERLIIKD